MSHFSTPLGFHYFFWQMWGFGGTYPILVIQSFGFIKSRIALQNTPKLDVI